jgi:HPr kinase/phosphorylase
VALSAEGGTLRAAAPGPLRGLLEVRGLGIFRALPVAEPAPALRLAVHLVPRDEVPRLPEPQVWTAAGVTLPALRLHGPEASAPAKLALALDAATGRAAQRAGGFA